MILVADSGSTKCDWVLLNEGKQVAYFTIGFNPLFHDAHFIESEIRKNAELLAVSDQVTEVYYYGASVSSPDRKAIVALALGNIFQHAAITVDHDMVGSVYATCGSEPGIACIIGTGSNSCFFDGSNISEKVPALGYILGDEAGGAWLGKQLLRDYLYHDVPDEIALELQNMGITKEVIFENVYKKPNANVYLASFARFLGKRQHLVYVQNLIATGFREFIKIHVCKFDNYKEVPVHFVGSVAFFSKDILQKVCAEFDIHLGVITNEPIHGLVNYHSPK